MQRILVVTSVAAERDAVLRGLNDHARFSVVIGGVGAAAAAASTAAALAVGEYDLVICAGIAGGFADVAEVGSLVVASEVVAADLGAENGENDFISIDELGFGSARAAVDASLAARLAAALEAAQFVVSVGPVLTLSTVTGTASSAAVLAKRVPGAAAEAMEGYGVAIAAQQRGIPFLELRSISNVIGPRDRSAWRIPQALQALEAASTVCSEVLR
ncbi:futalosine hydrolase [Paenibacillus taiwanensis]|uniref:futalosine hydrolase n=1 Tax=Paenibacillus taiwanensis TaxID=401638 RepID=UPI000490E9EE|nr:futalosine hydrolase [Paenibacillus taiwanensis]